MILNKTTEFMSKGIENGLFDGYGVYVHCKSENRFLSSDGFSMDTYVDVASMGKVLVTSTLILHCIDKGLLSLQSTLGDIFENVPSDKRDITVFSMLTHTSGIIRYNFPTETFPISKKDALEFILSSPLGFAQGEKTVYSCNAYILLGFIAEKILGHPLDVLMQEYIVNPLGLTRSRFCIPPEEKDVLLCCRWKNTENNRVDDENAYQLGGVGGNGASFWTCRDIVSFIEAVIKKDSRLFSSAMYDKSEINYTPGFDDGRGLGYLVVDENYRQTGRLFPVGSFGHCGHCGHSFFINRKEDLYVIVLTNATRAINRASGFNGYDYGNVKAMREKIHNAIYDDLKGENLL